MPIRISCPCGKTLNVRDELAGKAVKCPGCGKTLKVAAAAKSGAAAPTKSAPASKSTPAKKAAPSPGPSPSDGLGDLFDEEGFSEQVDAVCPACRAEMAGGAALCVKCGYNIETGERLDAHKTAGVDIDFGTLALEKAAVDMAAAKQMQKDLLSKAGMPWWALALILFILGSALLIGVLVVNASRRVDESFEVDGLALFLLLSGGAFYLVSAGAQLMILVHAFKQDTIKGLLCLFVPFYLLYYVIKNFRETWKLMATSIVMGGIAGGFIGVALSRGGV